MLLLKKREFTVGDNAKIINTHLNDYNVIIIEEKLFS